MGLTLRGGSQSAKVVAMRAASSLRASITTLLRRVNLAPAVLIIAGISFLAHILVGDNYGYFRDELYVLAMSQHPAFGYVDVPPLVPWITLIPRLLTNNALWAIHVISALVCAGTIVLTGLMARLLGGTRWVQGLAALGSATALVLMANGSIYTYDVFDAFWWSASATILIVLLRDERPRDFLAFGLVAGLGLLTKETILFWGFALILGLLLTRQRSLLFTRWTVFGGLIAFALVLPFLIWNATNGWASVQYWAGYSQNHSAGGSPLDFLINQILGMNPLSVLLWGQDCGTSSPHVVRAFGSSGGRISSSSFSSARFRGKPIFWHQPIHLCMLLARCCSVSGGCAGPGGSRPILCCWS
ncbi:ArnT family glycosyltransferase [Ktedonobacter robiniae]|uniref:Glycosyltransferase RgtA/B/C/D-like domain-containing protein n=1 Tax=Ktedonobacter robiniae TaxID=2778365 RepID=A0ABQ3V5F0_9CHLR|nr:glycosyltransferase family 39 protein [Ktedonobacter robiniae]GHO60163.1 hypothetical protein KSB_86380 [Ktedonobacter robiniae]